MLYYNVYQRAGDIESDYAYGQICKNEQDAMNEAYLHQYVQRHVPSAGDYKHTIAIKSVGFFGPMVTEEYLLTAKNVDRVIEEETTC